MACTWDDVKSLRTDMERNTTSAVHFRTKLLSAICQMQSALGLTDLGQLYYKPLRDSHGTVVLSCIQTVKSQKAVSILNSRWLPVNKLQKKIVALLEDYNINDMLIASIAEQIHYHQSSMQRLPPGLYLGYLKMQCSVEQIQVVVPAKTPNVLPHYKVRDNSHITSEEWQILKRGSEQSSDDNNSSLRMSLEFNAALNTDSITEGQRLFLYDLTTAAHKLFAYMNIKPEDAATHRLYDVEVIEHSKNISFLIICPSVELTCAVPGQSELLLQRDDLCSLSIQAFEMIHLRTYQPGIIQKYARLSCILELDTVLANHSHREAFSSSELQTAKERLAKLQELSSSLNVVWKSVRWLMDVIAFARDKNAQPSLAMKEILEYAQLGEDSSVAISSKQLLELPIRDVKFTKSGSGRGSWPGPAGSSAESNINSSEHSKSEQNLGTTAVTPTANAPAIDSNSGLKTNTTVSSNGQQLKVDHEMAKSEVSLRKSSADSMGSQFTVGTSSGACSNSELIYGAAGPHPFVIPPSRSEDMLSSSAATEGLRHAGNTSASSTRKRTSSNTTYSATTPTTPLITVHSSSSAPYLMRDACSSGSSLSLKSIHEVKPIPQTHNHTDISKVAKAASSSNLRESSATSETAGAGGCLYIKTLPILQIAAAAENIKCVDNTAAVIPLIKTSAASSSQGSTKTISRQSSEEETGSSCSLNSDQAAAASSSSNASSPGIIQVYTAYNTGLATGTSLKLHVTPKTTAREVINLVVKQLNMAAVLKGNNGPIYTAEMLDNFCLVAVIGARERCLRDDFKPLQLQNPWKKGRLYVRQKHELLAAIEHANRKSHLI